MVQADSKEAKAGGRWEDQADLKAGGDESQGGRWDHQADLKAGGGESQGGRWEDQADLEGQESLCVASLLCGKRLQFWQQLAARGPAQAKVFISFFILSIRGSLPRSCTAARFSR